MMPFETVVGLINTFLTPYVFVFETLGTLQEQHNFRRFLIDGERDKHYHDRLINLMHRT